MNKQAVLTFIKKNILSLTCGVVAILAVVATFYPLGDMITSLHDEATTLAGDFSSLQGMLTKTRGMPTTNPTATSNGNLTVFPNQATINWGKDQNANFAKTSQGALQYVQEINQKGHDPVLPGAFDRKAPDSTLLAFPNCYFLILSTDPTVSGVGDTTANPPLAANPTLHAAGQVNIQNDILHGCVPPTPEDIKAAQDALWKDKYYPMVILKNGVPVNEAELRAQCDAEGLTLESRTKRKVAAEHKMYVSKDAFTIDTAILPQVQPKLEDMWYAQMQVWIQHDLASAIAEENSKSGNSGIQNSPVKRLLQIYIPSSAAMYVEPPAAAGAAAPAPAPGATATVKDTDPIPLNYQVSPSGRYSNSMYDVVSFRMTVDVDASKVNEFIETMSHQRLITVNVENEYALDSDVQARNGYLYGPNPTVRLVLDGEILYMRAWTLSLMPEKIQQALGIIAGGTPGAGGASFGGPSGFGGPPPRP